MAGEEGRGLHVFDMDGTLLRSAATIELARYMGRLDAGHEIEERWYAGRISDREFWETLLEICHGASEADIDEAFFSSPWMPGLEETFDDIGSRGEEVLVISQSPAFFVRRLERWGAHETHGSAVEIGRPVSDTATLSPDAKLTITVEALARRQLRLEECVAYGDSTSDLSLFAALPHSVAVNAIPEVEALATAHYVGTDLRDAYTLGRDLLSRSDRTERSEP